MDAWVALAQAAGLVIGVPLFLIVVFAGLGWLEEWMLRPDERAEAVARLLEQLEQAEDVEVAVAQLMSPIDPPAERRPRQRTSVGPS